MAEIKSSLTTDPDGVELCLCNNCGSYLIDHNPKIGAKTYNESCADGELKQFTDLSGYNISHDIQYFWGCPNCQTDEYLTDI